MTFTGSSHRTHPLIHVVWIAASALLLAYSVIWALLLRQPALGFIDYISFYTAGRLARAGALANLYDLEAQRAIQREIVPPDFVGTGVLPFNHMAFLTPLLGMTVGGSYVASYIRWCAVLLAFLIACGWVLRRWLGDAGWPRGAGLAGALGLLLFYPMFIGLLKGQDTAIMLFGTLLWAWSLQRGDDRLAGLALGLTTLKPQLALALALPMLFARRRAFWWFCGAAAICALASSLLIGWHGIADLLALSRLVATGQGYGVNQAAMFNLVGLALRLAPGLPPAAVRGLAWGGFALGLALVCWRWGARRGRIGGVEIGLAALAATFFSPHLHYHDLSLLLVPMAALLAALPPRTGRSALFYATLLLLGDVALFAAELLLGASGFWLAYLLMLAMAVALLRLGRAASSRTAAATV
jgi:hypothetical protein